MTPSKAAMATSVFFPFALLRVCCRDLIDLRWLLLFLAAASTLWLCYLDGVDCWLHEEHRQTNSIGSASCAPGTLNKTRQFCG